MIGVYATTGREPRHGREREGDPWKRIATVVPRPGALVRPMVPPQLSTSRRAMASPRPDPLDVVENAGSKTRGSTSVAIPWPSSSTASPYPPSEMRTVTRRAPALRAFSSRLMRTSFTSSRRAEASPPGSPSSTTVAAASAPPSVYRCTTSRATAWTSTGSSGSASAAGDAKREHAGGAGEGGRVVERHDAAVGCRSQGRELHADLTPPHGKLVLHDALGRAVEELPHRVPDDEPLRRRRPWEQITWCKGRAQELRGARVRHRDPQPVVQGDDPGGHVGEHLRRAPPRLLE